MDKPGIGSIPILALTAGTPGQDVSDILASGMNDCLAKPFEPDELIRTVCRHLAPQDMSQPEELIPPGKAGGKHPQAFLDTAEGIRRIGGNRALYRELLRRFVSGYATSAKNALDAVNSGDLKKAGHIAHSVKGIAGVLAADSLQESARELETVLIKDRHTTHPVMERFRDELSAILAEAGTELRNPY